MKSYLAKSRLVPLVLIFGMILLIFCGVLYNTQILNGSDYKARSLASNATAQTVEASRGIITEMLTRKVLSGEITSLTPLMRGVRNSNNAIRIPLMAFLYRTLGPTRFVKGCNMAFWRNDLIRVNGYDESFCGWGREDSELAIRLDNSGVRQRCMKFRGVVFHLHHGKCERNSLSANEERYQQTIREHRTRCEIGLTRHLGETDQTRTPKPEVKNPVPASAGH